MAEEKAQFPEQPSYMRYSVPEPPQPTNSAYPNQSNYTVHAIYENVPPPMPPQYAQTHQQPVYMPPSTTPPEQMSWFARNAKNKPQSNSVGAAAMIFIVGGMQMAWGCGFSSYPGFPLTTNMIIGWYIGAIVGAILGAVLNNIVRRKFLLIFAAALIMVDGLIMLTASNESTAMAVVRYADGFALGLVFAPTMVLIGEESVRYLRGMLAGSIELMCYYMGIALQIMYALIWTEAMSQNFNVIQMMGTLNLLFGGIAILVLLCVHVESPIYHLVRGEEQQAIDCLRRLQRPYVATVETYEQLNAHRNYIAANKELSLAGSAREGLPALLLLTFLRVLVALSFSKVTVIALNVSVNVANHGAYSMGQMIFYGYIPWIAAMIALFMVDSCGRRKPIIYGGAICAGMAIGLGVLFGSYTNFFSSSQMVTAECLLIVYQFFASFYSISSSAYLSEAFPMAIKPFYIAIPFVTQMIVQIIITCCSLSWNSSSDYFYAVAAFSIFLVILAVTAFPETKHTTLLGAQDLFRTSYLWYRTQL